MRKKQQIAIATVGDVVQIMDSSDFSEPTMPPPEIEGLTKYILLIKAGFLPSEFYNFEGTVLLTTAEIKHKIAAASGEWFKEMDINLKMESEGFRQFFVSDNPLIAPDFYWLLVPRPPQ